MRQATVEELAYIAGIVDGEGSIGIQSRSPKYSRAFAIRLSIIMTTSQPGRLCHEVFGGNFCAENRVTVTGKPIYRWVIYCTKAAVVLQQLIPYLRVKKAVAEDCIALTKFYHQGKTLTQVRLEQREGLYNRILSYTGRSAVEVADESCRENQPKEE